MPLSMECIQTVEGMEALTPEWRALYGRDPFATPFQGPDWLTPWTRRLWGGGRLRILALRARGELAAVLPLFLWGYGQKPEILRISMAGSGVSDYLGMTVAPEHADEAAHVLWNWLLTTDDEWHVCDFQELRAGCPLLRVAPPAGLSLRETPCSVSPVLKLPERFDQYLGGLDAKFRHNLRTAENRLRRAGRVEFVEAPDRRPELLDALFRLHESRWRERGESGMLAVESLRRFHREASQSLADSGSLRLMGLQLSGETIAVQYNLCRNGSHFFYLSGFDPQFAAFSPGAVLIAHAIRRAIEEGAQEADFLRKGEGFKYQWGARDRSTRKLVITRANTSGLRVA